MMSVAILLLLQLIMTAGNIKAPFIKIHTISHLTNLKVMVKILMGKTTTQMVLEVKVQEDLKVDTVHTVDTVDKVDTKRMLMIFHRKNRHN